MLLGLMSTRETQVNGHIYPKSHVYPIFENSEAVYILPVTSLKIFFIIHLYFTNSLKERNNQTPY